MNLKISHSLRVARYSSVFVNPATGDVYKEGDILRRPALAASLEAIQDDPDALYTGALSKPFMQDLEALGSIITQRDLEQYKSVHDYRLYQINSFGVLFFCNIIEIQILLDR